MLSDFDEARSNSGAITSNYECGASLVTQAGSQGSLEQQEDCIIKFDSARPAVWDLPVPEAADVAGGSLLSKCGYDACEFDISSIGKGGTYKIITVEGCLTSDGLESGRGIKTKPCKEGAKNQEWFISGDKGHVVSELNTKWCISNSGQRLVIDLCEEAVAFGYNMFDKSMFLLGNPDKVVTVGVRKNRRVKIERKNGDLSEHIELMKQ